MFLQFLLTKSKRVDRYHKKNALRVKKRLNAKTTGLFLRVAFSGEGSIRTFTHPPPPKPQTIYLMYIQREKMLTSSVICWHHEFLCNKKLSKNPKKSMKIINIDGENLHISWTIGVISMNFSEKNAAYDNFKNKKKRSASPLL